MLRGCWAVVLVLLLTKVLCAEAKIHTKHKFKRHDSKDFPWKHDGEFVQQVKISRQT